MCKGDRKPEMVEGGQNTMVRKSGVLTGLLMSMNYTKMQMEETCIVICRSDTNIYIVATISYGGIPWNTVLWITSKEVLLPFPSNSFESRRI
jgi:hypothetical protein